MNGQEQIERLDKQLRNIANTLECHFHTAVTNGVLGPVEDDPTSRSFAVRIKSLRAELNELQAKDKESRLDLPERSSSSFSTFWSYLSEMTGYGSGDDVLEDQIEIRTQTFRRAQGLYKKLKKTTRSSVQSSSTYSTMSKDFEHDGKQLTLLDNGSAVRLLRRLNDTSIATSRASMAVYMKHSFAKTNGPIEPGIIQAAFVSIEKEIKHISTFNQVQNDSKLSGILESALKMARRCAIILNKCGDGQLSRDYEEFATDRFKAIYTLIQKVSSLLQEIAKLEKPIGVILSEVDMTPLAVTAILCHHDPVIMAKKYEEQKMFVDELHRQKTLRASCENFERLLGEFNGFVRGTEDLLRKAVSKPVDATLHANSTFSEPRVCEHERAEAAKYLEENPRLRSLYVNDEDPDYFPTCHASVSQGEPASIAESIAKMKELNLFEWEDYPSGKGDPHDSGSFGIVYKVPFVHDGLKVAMKQFKVKSDEAAAYKRVTREAMIVSELNHENISPFYGYRESPAYEAIDIALVSPFYPQGNLRDFVRDTRKGVKPELVKVKLLRDVARALQYLHNPNKKGGIVIHGDLRAMNVLIGPNQKALLCDFGMATRTDLDPKWHTKTNQTNNAYLAYEFFDLKKTKPIALSIKTDTYAFGCICYEVFYEDYPYHDVDGRHIPILKSKKEPPTTTNIPRKYRLEMGYRQLLARCWHPEPSRRPSATRLVEYLDEFVSFLTPPRS